MLATRLKKKLEVVTPEDVIDFLKDEVETWRNSHVDPSTGQVTEAEAIYAEACLKEAISLIKNGTKRRRRKSKPANAHDQSEQAAATAAATE